jgi:hypothetical protein
MCALRSCRPRRYLLHCPEHLIAAPFWESPVIVILLDTADANGAVGTTASTQKPSSGKPAFLSIQAWLRWGDDVPVKRSVVAFSPSVMMNLSAIYHAAGMPQYTYAPGICTFSTSALSEPASKMRTVTFGSSERRPATTGPQVPPLNLVSWCTTEN